ncbi:hypothetical protein GCM10025779_26430 [Arthrobacter cryoconiti]
MEAAIGSNKSAFVYGDVVADADTWLMVKAIKAEPVASLSDTMRHFYKLSDAERIKRFYSERFGTSESNIANAFIDLVDGLDAIGINLGFTVDKLMETAHTSSMPTRSQTETLGRAYGRI